MGHHDPKYWFGSVGGDDRVWHEGRGEYIPDDEPLCLLRGKDVFALAAMFAYVQACEAVADSADYDDEIRQLAAEHSATMSERIQAFGMYQQANRAKTGFDCSTLQQ